MALNCCGKTSYIYIGPSETCIPQRYIFAIIGFLMTAVNTILQMSLDVTIKHMVAPNVTKVMYDNVTCPRAAGNISVMFMNDINVQDTYDFTWSDATVSDIMSAYLLSYISIVIIFGILADSRGGKNIMGYCMLVFAVNTILTPIIVKNMGANGLLHSRYLSGVVGAPAFPVLCSMMTKWVPRNEQTLFAAIIFPGAIIGRALAICLGDLILSISGWQTVYYIFGSLGILCFLLWMLFVYNSPNDHPAISIEEKEYLNSFLPTLVRSAKHELDPMPWTACLKNGYVWVLCFACGGFEIAYVTLTTRSSQYMNDVFKYDISKSVIYTCLPLLSMWVASLFFGIICNNLINGNYLSYLQARKLFTFIGALGSATCIALLGYVNCSPTLAIVYITLGMAFLGAFYSGALMGGLDITQNYTGHTVGLIDNIAMILAWLAPIVQPNVTNALQSQWRIIFYIPTTILLVSLIAFLLLAQADQVWWDDVREIGYPDDWKHGLLSVKAVIDYKGNTQAKALEKEIIEQKLRGKENKLEQIVV